MVKGMQTQTAECLLIGELTCSRMVVILNKTDLLPPNKRQSAIEKMTKRLHKTLESTRYAHRQVKAFICTGVVEVAIKYVSSLGLHSQSRCNFCHTYSDFDLNCNYSITSKQLERRTA